MLPIIAIVGRPNVGKSTLFNRLTRSRHALVSDVSGLTRDRQYGFVEHQGKTFIVVDTGGIDDSDVDENRAKRLHSAAERDTRITELIAKQAWQAVAEADAILFVVDARAGLTAGDKEIIQQLRKAGKEKNALLVVNKVDGLKLPQLTAEVGDFCSLGLVRPYLISAEHGDGVKELLSTVLERIDPTVLKSNAAAEDGEKSSGDGVKIAFIGRPNVGKSTLVNRILGEERVIVSPEAGTTRDSIFINFTRRGKPYTLIDTAGVRRRGRIADKIEKFSVIKSLQAIAASNVVVLVLDAAANIAEQDLHLLGFALESGRAIVIAVNKWDGLSITQRQSVRDSLDRRLTFIDFAPLHFISALHGTGVGDLFPSIDKAYASANRQIKTPMATRILQAAVEKFPPPLAGGRRIKLRYAHVGGHNPPLIVIHGNQTDSVPVSYRKYLEREFRHRLRLVGTPIRIEFKTGENPYDKKT